jgi:hypothetical protein
VHASRRLLLLLLAVLLVALVLVALVLAFGLVVFALLVGDSGGDSCLLIDGVLEAAVCLVGRFAKNVSDADGVAGWVDSRRGCCCSGWAVLASLNLTRLFSREGEERLRLL